MLQYISRKLLHLIPITFSVTALSFFFVDLLPGDVADSIAGVGTDNAVVDEAAVMAIREDLGLDKPFLSRYFSWLGGIFTGDFGKSYQTGQFVFDAIVLRLPVTLQLLIMAQCLAVLFALPAGIFAAYRSGRSTDKIITTLTFAFLAAPSFIIAIAFIRVLLTNIFPISKYFFDLSVEAPQYFQLATLIVPMLSVSFLNFIWIK